MGDIAEVLAEIVGAQHVLSGAAVSDDYAHDEALTATPVMPLCVVRPANADEVAAIVKRCAEQGVPLTARGSGTGMSGACIPREDGVLVSFERMSDILEIDLDNHMAVVQPGVTLQQLDAATAEHGLVYPVFPGENSASLGGNVATNAGGLRAIKYGVTRNQVLGLEAVLGTGEVVRTGGKFVKATSGYDLTQLIIGSEGTLAIVTEAILKLYPRRDERGDAARAVHDARGDHRRGSEDRPERCEPADPRVHRPRGDVRDPAGCGPRPRHPAGHQGQGACVPRRRPGGPPSRATRAGHRDGGRAHLRSSAPWTSTCCPPTRGPS